MFIIIAIALIICVMLVWLLKTPDVEKQIQEGFPPEWEKIISRKIAFYQILSDPLKIRFKDRIHRFVLSKSIVGYQTEIDDELRILVAASAVMLTLAFEKWHFNYLDGVIIVDGQIEDHSGKKQPTVLGQFEARGFQSKLVLSKSSLVQGFKNLEDRKNVGIHEFAHALDHADGDVDGIPRAIMPKEMVEEWSSLVQKEIEDICNNHSDIDEYGGTSPSEFFAVITEYFFENPHILKKKHPRIYEILSKSFQQDTSNRFAANFKQLVSRMKETAGRNSPCPCGSGKKFKKCCMRV